MARTTHLGVVAGRHRGQVLARADDGDVAGQSVLLLAGSSSTTATGSRGCGVARHRPHELVAGVACAVDEGAAGPVRGPGGAGARGTAASRSGRRHDDQGDETGQQGGAARHEPGVGDQDDERTPRLVPNTDGHERLATSSKLPKRHRPGVEPWSPSEPDLDAGRDTRQEQRGRGRSRGQGRTRTAASRSGESEEPDQAVGRRR